MERYGYRGFHRALARDAERAARRWIPPGTQRVGRHRGEVVGRTRDSVRILLDDGGRITAKDSSLRTGDRVEVSVAWTGDVEIVEIGSRYELRRRPGRDMVAGPFDTGYEAIEHARKRGISWLAPRVVGVRRIE